MTRQEISYLSLLSEQYPSIESAVREIVDLSATLKLPKGTEYYFSDLHGEHEAFIHLLRSASGNIRDKVDLVHGETLSLAERNELVELIYYPNRSLIKHRHQSKNYAQWSARVLARLIPVCREVASKYSRPRVMNTMSPSFRSIMDEMIFLDNYDTNKANYFQELIDASIRSGIGDGLIDALCHLIQHITVDHLHILGDIFDRGPRADRILDELVRHRHVDIQWGNHDIAWIGAAAGSEVCMCSVLRIALSYNCFDLLEDGYGINLRPLSMFASHMYAEDPCTAFQPHILDENVYDPVDPALAAKMHKAVAILMFKLEGQLIARHPEYHLGHRLLLDQMDLSRGVVSIGGQEYPLTDTHFPTLDPQAPYTLSPEEQEIIDGLSASFLHGERLQRQMTYVVNRGGMYKACNGNLLYHGCIPMEESGTFSNFEVSPGKALHGKTLLDYLEQRVRRGFFSRKQKDLDLFWYLWCGRQSPLFGKSRMTTFERYFVADRATWTEPKNPYYRWYEEPEAVNRILREFHLDPASSHIVNGHVPVKQGENPIKAGGKLFVIDGGISKAYQSTTGIAGYTLIYNSHALKLAEHMPFRRATEDAPAKMFTNTRIVEPMPHRITIAETDKGRALQEKIQRLEALVKLYRNGTLKQQS